MHAADEQAIGGMHTAPSPSETTFPCCDADATSPDPGTDAPHLQRHLRRGEYLFREGEAMNAVFVVCNGFFRASAGGALRQGPVGQMLVRGDVIGADMLDAMNYPCDVIAIDDGDVWTLPRSLLQSGGGFECGLGRRLSEAVEREMRRWTSTLPSPYMEGRIAHCVQALRRRLDQLISAGRQYRQPDLC